jgi:hypothetical protein
MVSMEIPSETSQTPSFSDLTTSSTPFSWSSWGSSEQMGIIGWSQRLINAWEEERFEDAISQIEEYMGRIVPFVNDVLLIVGLIGKSNCHLAMGHYEEALGYIEQIERKLDGHQATLDEFVGNDQHKEFLNQYKSFILLNLGREEEAVQMLRENPPKCLFTQGIYRDIENKLGIELFDPKANCELPFFDSFGIELTGANKTLYDKLIGDWLKK